MDPLDSSDSAGPPSKARAIVSNYSPAFVNGRIKEWALAII